ncbi:hypothetical protein [Saccharicrinis sp. 156]|uniref:hypothetical protein n=1 Tax=Saccharicrinis sp. 156 TaxID=3417574 RepID=UPI003D33A4A4
MNKSTHILYTVVFLLSLFKITAAQEVKQPSHIPIMSNRLHEEVTLFTDRSIYAVGEDIFLQANYRKNIVSDREFSTVLYVELIKPDGMPVQQLKWPIDGNKAVGTVQIPNNLLTGIYYLKAYTRWMRNYPTESYAYSQVKIINPTSPVLNQNHKRSEDSIKYCEVSEIPNFEINLDKLKYLPGERINVELKTDNNSGQVNNYCVAVVKEGAKNLTETCIIQNYKNPGEGEDAYFMPEINGLAISGTVLNSTDKQPVDNALVSLALLGKNPVFEIVYTDIKGRFYLQVPDKTGADELFINAEKNDLNLTIEIDLDFCNRAVNLNHVEFSLSEKEKLVAEEICINAQINQLFESVSELDNTNVEKDGVSFFGEPDKTFYTEEYIDLVSIKDFIHELIPEIKNAKEKLTLFSNNGQINSLRSQPFLLLVDNVSISDEDVFLNIITSKVERIELINSGYIVGDQAYCGIISVFSKNNDMAGVELPKNGMFFKCALLDKNKKVIGAESENPADSISPDRRNCLFWDSNLSFNDALTQYYSFSTSDIPGTYQIIVHGIDKNGEEYQVSKISFEVEK